MATPGARLKDGVLSEADIAAARRAAHRTVEAGLSDHAKHVIRTQFAPPRPVPARRK